MPKSLKQLLAVQKKLETLISEAESSPKEEAVYVKLGDDYKHITKAIKSMQGDDIEVPVAHDITDEIFFRHMPPEQWVVDAVALAHNRDELSIALQKSREQAEAIELNKALQKSLLDFEDDASPAPTRVYNAEKEALEMYEAQAASRRAFKEQDEGCMIQKAMQLSMEDPSKEIELFQEVSLLAKDLRGLIQDQEAAAGVDNSEVINALRECLQSHIPTLVNSNLENAMVLLAEVYELVYQE